MQRTNLDCFANSQMINIDDELLRQICINSFSLQFSHLQSKLTTGFNTFGMTFQNNRNFHFYRFLVRNLKEVHVKKQLSYRSKLHILDDCQMLYTIDSQIYDINLRRVNQVADS